MKPHSLFFPLLLMLLSSAAMTRAEPRVPMSENFEDSLQWAWLNKELHDSILLSDMETMHGWSGGGEAAVSLTADRFIDGTSSLRFETPLRDEERIARGGRMMGASSVTLTFPEPQDWSEYNRIALWIYVHPVAFRVHPFYLRFECLDAPSAITDEKYATVIQGLTPGQWNCVFWEFPNLRRDKVTQFSIVKLLTGNDAGEDGRVVYDFDRLELQLVDAEQYEGWEVAPGKLAWQHIGYTPGQTKEAFASDLNASHFQLREAHSGQVVLTKSVTSVANDLGRFQVLDFSEVSREGDYFLWAGNRTSRPFPIRNDVWLEPIRKSLNFYFAQRCGFDVPGVHPLCHSDCFVEHNGERRHANGGWHDAGDLSQGSFRTDMSVYSMLRLLQQLEACEMEDDLQEQLLEEARWGLDWLLRTRFNDGYRLTWNSMGIYTDGIVGTTDDIVREPQNNPWENFIASAVEAFAGQVLKDRDPALAQACFTAARQDWDAAVQLQTQWLDEGKVVLTGGGMIDNTIPFSHRWFSGGMYLTLSWGILSSLHLHDVTGEEAYAEKALEYAGHLIRCQEREFPDGIPLTGWFYTSPARDAVVNHRHAAFEESPLLALRALCETFPDRPEWIEWYGAAILHSEYFLKRGSRYTAPYNALPNAVFRKSDFDLVEDEELRAAMLDQYMDGIRLSDDYRLRFFPIWATRTHHGNTAAQLSQTLALVSAAQIRNDLSVEDLARAQLRWVFGGNPFSQTMMYGEGHDYPPLYGYNPGDIVGALPVGMDSVRGDLPFWSASNHSTFKEIWVVPVNRFLWNAAYLGMPSHIRGSVRNAEKNSIEFFERTTSTTQEAALDSTGGFEAVLPSGDYEIRWDGTTRRIVIPAGVRRKIALDSQDTIDVSLRLLESNPDTGRVSISAIAKGAGRHELTARILNGSTSEPSRVVDLGSGTEQQVIWNLDVVNRNLPWVVVVVPDGDTDSRQELTGALVP